MVFSSKLLLPLWEYKAVLTLITLSEKAEPALRSANLGLPLHEAATAATGLEARFRKAATWVTWKHLLMVAVGCASVVLAAWIAVGWQRYEVTQLSAQKAALQTDIATMRATVDSLAKKSGRIRLTTCGEQKRKCVKVDSAAGTFGGQGETYMIVDGY